MSSNEIQDKSKKLNRLISAADSIAIFGHQKPDGDCIGSVLGLYNYLIENYPDKTVEVYTEGFPAPFKILKGAKKVKHEPVKKCFDLGICLDVSDPERMSKFKDMYLSSISTVCIDHHVSNSGFGDLCYIDADASSTAEVLTDFMDMDKISESTASCLYLGIVHDTGVFKYSCTSRKTMEVAGMLLEKGVNASHIIDDTFYKKTYKQNLLMSKTVLESVLYYNGALIIGYIPKTTFQQFKATPLDTEGIVEQLRLTEGVEVAVLAYQINKKTFKLSFRSKDYVNVCEICEGFGGGGHVRAAGANVTGNIKNIMNEIVDQVGKQLKKK